MKTNFEFIHYLILGLTFFFAVMAICIYRKAKRDAEKIFNSDYENLIRAIRSGKSEQKYYTILAQFHRLRKTPGVNHEKLDVAWAEFVKTFRA